MTIHLGGPGPQAGSPRDHPGLGPTGGPYGGFHMGGCQNYGPFLSPYYNTAPNI